MTRRRTSVDATICSNNNNDSYTYIFMRKYIHLSILFTTIASFLLTSCREEDDGIVEFSVEKSGSSVLVDPEGGTEYLQVVSPIEWTVTSNKPWVSVSPANGIGNTKCSVLVDSTLENGVREAELRFVTMAGDQLFVAVVQGGFDKQIALGDSVKTIPSSTNSITDRYVKAEVSANVNFKLQVVDSLGTPVTWLVPKQMEIRPNLDRGSRLRTTMIQFDWKINSDTLDRVAYVNFLPLDVADQLSQSAVLTIIQEAAPVITDDRAGDSLAVVSIMNRLQIMSPWDVTENMQHWANVTLWEATDKDLPDPKAVGRVRSAKFMMCNTKESIPQEVRYLKYIETLNVYSNVNTMFLNIELGSDICGLKHLKHLQIGAFGLVSLPDDFYKLGKTLETLDLNSNNFPEIPAVLTKENFPRLKSLNILACRRWTVYDLRKRGDYDDRDGIGMHFNTADNDGLRRLLLWDTLEELRLSNNYIEGELPTFVTIVDGDTIVDAGVPVWTADDVAGNDTLQNLVGYPKILPRTEMLSLNLNFFTGNAPDWLLYHPRLLDWFPESLIFMQKENGLDSEGKLVKFDNEPANYEYYYDFFPGYREKYEIKEERDE